MLPLVFACLTAWPPTLVLAASSDDPPPGIKQTSLKLQTVLDANDAAVGSLAHRSITSIEAGRIQAYGMAGRFRDAYTSLHADTDYHTTITLGPLSWQEGQYKGQRWHQNENGITTNLHPKYSSEGADVKLLAADAENPKNDVSLLGGVESPVSAYVVQVKRKTEAPYWLFYDKQTSLLDRVEIGYADERHVVTLDDYRAANGQKEAWHTHESTIGNPANDWDRWIETVTLGSPIADADLKIPPSNKALVEFPAGVDSAQLPVKFLDGDLIVRVSINGRGLDFLLDTAFPGMLLDSQVAKDLRLPNFGPRAPGSDVAEEVQVSDLALGDLIMRNVFVNCEPFNYRANSATKVVGVIGFDFLASTVVDIDYEREKVGASRSDAFTAPATPYLAEVNLDDGVPLISAQFESAVGTRFLLDTAAASTSVYSSFWISNPSLVPPHLKWRISSSGIYSAVQFKDVQIAGLELGNFAALLAAPGAPGASSDRDGVLGRTFLALFHVYFDYAHQRVYFVPSSATEKELHKAAAPGGSR